MLTKLSKLSWQFSPCETTPSMCNEEFVSNGWEGPCCRDTVEICCNMNFYAQRIEARGECKDNMCDCQVLNCQGMGDDGT